MVKQPINKKSKPARAQKSKKDKEFRDWVSKQTKSSDPYSVTGKLVELDMKVRDFLEINKATFKRAMVDTFKRFGMKKDPSSKKGESKWTWDPDEQEVRDLIPQKRKWLKRNKTFFDLLITVYANNLIDDMTRLNEIKRKKPGMVTIEDIDELIATGDAPAAKKDPMVMEIGGKRYKMVTKTVPEIIEVCC